MRIDVSSLWRAGRYSISGAVGVAAYYATLYLLTKYLGVWYIKSALIGFALKTVITFALQKFWTFRSKKVKGVVWKQLVSYLAMTALFVIVDVVFLYLLVERYHLGYMLAQVAIMFAFSLPSFLLTARVFKKEKETDAE